MLDRNYFKQILPDQLQLMERPVRMTLHLNSGDEYMVQGLIAAHDSYVVLKVYTDGKAAKHTKRWQAENPNDDSEIPDRVCIPYASIAFVHITARSTKGHDADRLIGFQET
jgi:hypothetical protein